VAPTTSSGAAPTSAISNPSSFTVISSSTSINCVSAAGTSGLMSCTWALDKGPGLPYIYHYGVSSHGLPPATSTLISGNPNSFAVPSLSLLKWNIGPFIYCAEVGASCPLIGPSDSEQEGKKRGGKGRLPPATEVLNGHGWASLILLTTRCLNLGLACPPYWTIRPSAC
jgi:hypothetical protein